LAAILGFTSGTVGLLIAAVAVAVGWIIAIGLVIDDLATYFRGGKSAIGEWIAANRDANTTLGALARLAQQNLDLFRAIGGYVGATLSPIIDGLASAFAAVGDAIATAYNFYAKWLNLPTTNIGTGLIDKATGVSARASANLRAASTIQDVARAYTTSRSTSVTGGTYNISGLGMSAAEGESMVRGLRGEELRQAYAVVGGGSR
jgi:hypothetical protein